MKMIKYGNYYEDELNEICPVCGSNWVHVGETILPLQEAISEDEGGDHRAVPDVKINFWGECGHEWIREWHTSKGITSVRIYIKKLEQIV